MTTESKESKYVFRGLISIPKNGMFRVTDPCYAIGKYTFIGQWVKTNWHKNQEIAHAQVWTLHAEDIFGHHRIEAVLVSPQHPKLNQERKYLKGTVGVDTGQILIAGDYDLSQWKEGDYSKNPEDNDYALACSISSERESDFVPGNNIFVTSTGLGDGQYKIEQNEDSFVLVLTWHGSWDTQMEENKRQIFQSHLHNFASDAV